MKKLFMMAIFLSALFCGCGEGPQEKAYDEALKSEEAVALTITSSAPMLIMKYSNVIAIDPKTKWAKRSQNRIDLLRGIMQDDQNAQRGRTGR
jgi:hypothetical protein